MAAPRHPHPALRPGTLLIPALVAATLLVAAAGAAADVVRDARGVPAADARGVFELVKRGFERGDQQALADLVHEDGVRIRRGGGAARDTEYSPSQSFYYFKNLFQTEPTVSFVFQRMEETAVGARVHAMAVWTHRTGGGGAERRTRLVFVLGRQGETWRLTEITTIG